MAQVNVRIDDTIKKKAESACAAMGLTMASAISIFLTKVANEQRIPFEVSVEKRIADRKAGRNTHERELIEVD